MQANKREKSSRTETKVFSPLSAAAAFKKRPEMRYLLTLAFLWAIFYHRLLLGMRFLWEDVVEQMYPSLHYAAYCLSHGIFPFWTPYVFSGMPFFSDMLMPFFYPPQWLLLGSAMVFGSRGVLFAWYILAHVLVFGIGIFFLCRSFGWKNLAAFFSAVAGMFSASLTLNVIHATYLYVAAWTPFAFLVYRRALNSGLLRDVLIAGLLLGLTLLGSYPQPAVHFIYLIFVWTVFASVERRKLGVWRMVSPFAVFGLWAGIGAALAAVQYLPALEHQSQSLREAMTFEESCKGAVRPTRLLTLLAPRFFGYVCDDPSASSPYWGNVGMGHLFWETTVFVGVTTLLLALRAWVGMLRTPLTVYFTVMAALLLLLSMGEHTPLYWIAFHWVPGLGAFRIPARFAFWLSLCLALLGGQGVEMLLKSHHEDEKRYRRLLVVIVGIVAVAALAFLSGVFDGASPYFTQKNVLENARGSMGILLLSVTAAGGVILWMLHSNSRLVHSGALATLVFVELFLFGEPFGCGRTDPQRYFGRFSLEPLQREMQSAFFRVQSRLYRGENRGEMLLPRNLGNIERVPLTEGYNQLMLKRYNDFLYKIDEVRARKLLCVRYVKVPGEPRLQRLPDACPRFFISGKYRVFNTSDSLISYMNSQDFIPCVSLALEREPPIPIDSTAEGWVRAVAENPGRIELEVEAQANALLCINDVYYPAWQATIDGKPAVVEPTNLLFRSVAVPRGRHRVVVAFRSSSLARGAAISLVTLAAVTLLLAFGKFIPLASKKPLFSAAI